ncbi:MULTISPECIES: tRNA (guanosine(37)-N1)-methyltransferase TrmD [Sphingobacterium]|jgi:tRNA (guanine37-N1)-methyltransferase|uniref:tRNA (guanine-N(1)-)-methyltransferase n=1 Tax=Sphingobacterium kitahiroshimense TaxID=470446 RepID=A0ABV0BS95_9SPHI|nr:MULTISPECIES: tRNA (guanosine(37)-N1)-methyltransferase TrmD [Sphingobacterium]KKX51207.1 tRNA (guanine-N1)-methyltransferase [Sphingobacterium sp. IITKGP-BTPF85]MCS3555218.1 tRNA (guanine37-N1)-methyltransferase [Sphingobacterium sp. JUb21]MCW2261558.1 tRNA (guanine37-N1)-methyltransferase [Sphingobacterium kitahiroshimense]NJI75302.1 tRNA (guanosine(37)-N1)-methyltransferase TrmD [Sphingobacterium sp. B16(2022)]QQD14927.1 tRNA (guanosine(37)-N1)-methyltransferase TrmD [Sphingobacterium sp
MRFDIITVLPSLLDSPFAHSILQRAQKKGLAEIVVHNLRDYATNKQKSVDDYPYGGGSGMVMQIEPFAACIEKLQAERTYDEIIFMSPDGETLNQEIANNLSTKGNMMILCGHYKGIDQRIRDIYVTKEISVGDYVLSGGELPAAILTDAIIRLIPGVLSDETSALSDSFQDGLLDAPIYTRPADWKGHKVPDVLLSGHEAKILQWRDEQQLIRTRERRPDLLND